MCFLQAAFSKDLGTEYTSNGLRVTQLENSYHVKFGSGMHLFQ